MAETDTTRSGSRSGGTAQGSGRRSGLRAACTRPSWCEVVRKKAHPFYKRVVSKAKKFYAHDEKNVAHVGDVVRLEETRPLSKLKRWRLKEVVRTAALVPEVRGRGRRS